MTKLTFLAAALLAATLPAAAHAEVRTKQVRVYYGDLRLDTRADALTMLTRIDNAAKRACLGLMTGPIELRAKRAEMQCRSQAVGDAVADLGAPQVSFAHASRLGATTEIASR